MFDDEKSQYQHIRQKEDQISLPTGKNHRGRNSTFDLVTEGNFQFFFGFHDELF